MLKRRSSLGAAHLAAVVLMTGAALALPAGARGARPPAAAPAQAGKDDLYRKFLDSHRGGPEQQRAAYDAGREYLARYGTPEDDLVRYLRSWVAKYEAAPRQYPMEVLMAEGRYPEAFAAGKEVLTREPEDLTTLIRAAEAGMFTARANPSVAPEAGSYARKAIALIEAGRTPGPGSPFQTKDKTLGFLYYLLGYSTLQADRAGAIGYLYKSARHQEWARQAPQTYALLASAVETGYYSPLSEEYKGKCAGPLDPAGSATCAQMLAQINQVLDYAIDTYARAVGRADAIADPATQAQAKGRWMERLSVLYKFRNQGSESNLIGFIKKLKDEEEPPPPPPPPPPGCPKCMDPEPTPAPPRTPSRPGPKAPPRARPLGPLNPPNVRP